MEEEIIRCQVCGKEIGKLVETDKQWWFCVNGIVVTVMRGVCECGAVFNWSISEYALARLINRVKQFN